MGRLAIPLRVRRGARPGAGLAAAALVATYVLARAVTLADAVPPWQGPDEPGHAEYALLLAEGRMPPAEGDPRLERRILASMERHAFYDHLGIAPPARPPRAFSDVARLGGDPTQMASETPVGYVPYALAAAAAGTADVGAALGAMRLVSAALVVVVVLLAYLAAREVMGARTAVAAAGLVAAAPALGFAGAVVNNDLIAAALGALWFAVLAHGMRGRAKARTVVLLLGIALLAAAAKRTGLYLVPMTAVAAGWLFHLDTPSSAHGNPRPALRVAARHARSLALPAAVLLAAGTVIYGWPLTGTAAHWSRTGATWGDVQVAGAGRGGTRALRVVDDRALAWQYLSQETAVEGGEAFFASVWLRAADGEADAALVVNDDAGNWWTHDATLGASWQRLDVRGRIDPAAASVRLALVPGRGTAAGTGAILADDASLLLQGRQRLQNGGGEVSRRLGSIALSRAARYADIQRLVGSAPGGLRDPVGTLRRAWRGLFFSYRSFWGGFGWLMLWPGPRYDNIAGALSIFAAAAAVVAMVAPGRIAATPAAAGFLRLCALSAVAAIAVSIAGSMAGWGGDSLPQGRYLLPALVPMALVAIALAEALVPRYGGLVLAGAAIALDLAIVVGVVLPGFAGP